MVHIEGRMYLKLGDSILYIRVGCVHLKKKFTLKFCFVYVLCFVLFLRKLTVHSGQRYHLC